MQRELPLSKRSRGRRAQQADTPLAPEAPSEGGSLFRRVLLALLTGLIVSRPFLRGESLGLASDLSDAGGLLWAFFVLLACAAWAGWRLFTRQAAVRAGIVEIALLVGVGVLFLGTAWASYRRASLLAGWEWLGLVMALFLTRQLAASERERQGLFAVLLATAVASSVQGVYQSLWELPRSLETAWQRHGDDVATYVRFQFARGLEAPDVPETEILTRRLEDRRAHGPYLYPSTLAAMLVLLLPGLAGAALGAIRLGGHRWQQWLTTVFAVVALAALLLTREWLFVLALPLACAVVLPRARVAFVLLAVGVGGVLYTTANLTDDIARRGEAWGATWRLLADGRNGSTGVGPGQVGFSLPAYLSETAGAPAGPESGFLEMWAEGGVAALLAFGAAALAVLFAAIRWWHTTPPAERDAVHEPSEDLPWEFYLGGMIGVVLAFLVRASTLTQDTLISGAMMASLGALAWFAAFAAFEQLPWTRGGWMSALSCGVLALALALLVNPGLGMPSLTGLLMVALGLLLAEASPAPVRWLDAGGASLNLPVPLLGAAAFSLLVFVVVPAASTASVHRRTRLEGLHYAGERDRATLHDPVGFITERIIKPLQEARRQEQLVVRTYLLLADWELEAWRWQAWETQALEDRVFERANKARDLLASAYTSNHRSPEPLRHQITLRERIAAQYKYVAASREKWAEGPKKGPKIPVEEKKQRLALAAKWRGMAVGQYKLAVEAANAAIRRDPTNPELHYRLARALSETGDKKAGREAAAEAKRLDGKVGRARRLSDRQREAVEAWLKGDSRK